MDKHCKTCNRTLPLMDFYGATTGRVSHKCKSQAHHDDYNKPLDVRWLCATHHAEHHKNIRQERAA